MADAVIGISHCATTTTGRDVNAAALPAKDTPTGTDIAAPGVPASRPLIVGLDLSLGGTGVAHLRAGLHVTDRLVGTGTGISRLRRLTASVRDLCRDADLVVVEGPSYGSAGRGHHDLAGLWWLVQDRLCRDRLPVAVVPPASLKTYALGKGSGKGVDKTAVALAATTRLSWAYTNLDEADALWLAEMGHAWLTGVHRVPVGHRRALDGCDWPERGEAA